MFSHYGFNDKIVEEGKLIVEEFSLSNRKKKQDKHIRNGSVNQWVSYFTPEIKKRFNLLFPDLLVKTGYEKEEWI